MTRIPRKTQNSLQTLFRSIETVLGRPYTLPSLQGSHGTERDSQGPTMHRGPIQCTSIHCSAVSFLPPSTLLSIQVTTPRLASDDRRNPE